MDYAKAAKFARSLLHITKLAREAALAGDFTVARKHDNSPVTKVDEVTQDRVVHLCRQQFGGTVTIIAEEKGFDQSPKEVFSPWTVYIDPIDGTVLLSAGDITSANIAIGIFYNGKPFVGFIGQLSNGEVVFGGTSIGGIFEMRVTGETTPLKRPPVALENKLWGFEIGKAAWANPVHRGTLINLFDAHDMMGGRHYVLPCVAAGLKVIFGHSRFFMGVPNARSWDVGALMPLLEVSGGRLVKLATGEQIQLGNTADFMPSFLIADSVESVDYVLGFRPTNP